MLAGIRLTFGTFGIVFSKFGRSSHIHILTLCIEVEYLVDHHVEVLWDLADDLCQRLPAHCVRSKVVLLLLHLLRSRALLKPLVVLRNLPFRSVDRF